MKTRLTFLSLLLVFSLSGYSQSISTFVVNATGSSDTKNGLMLDWSVGEVALVNTMDYQMHRFILTNGFLQSEYTAKVPGSSFFGAGEVSILPNPTNGKFTVRIENKQQGKVAIDVFDVNGKRIFAGRTAHGSSVIIEKFDLTAQTAGTYLVQVTLTPLIGLAGKTAVFRLVKI
jgi:hypothetical protein